MSVRFEVIEARRWHIGQICRRLRGEHRASLIKIGYFTHRELDARFHESAVRRAWLIDGELAALGGVTGAEIAPVGQVWLAVSEQAMRYPLAMVKEARRQLDDFMLTRHELFTIVLGGDEAAQRFAIFLGFHAMEGGETPGRRAYSRGGRRHLARYLDSPGHRMVLGNSFAIPLRYHHEAA